MNIIVGLGNPGEKYINTRHNVGFLTLDKIIQEKNLNWNLNKKFSSLMARDGDTIYIKPQTFINKSGRAVEAILSYYKMLPKKFGMIKEKKSDLTNILTVIHDDLDIEIGKFKLADNSRSGGHKGVESIIQYLKTKNFKRIRIGIKNELKEKIPTEKFVLMNFSKEEKITIAKVFENLEFY
jgi:PTH1 family peptidyl-tRNA hydrolase